ncbi:helix-turn-helix transcriptional regulator [Nocardioides sp. P5_E3]
MPRPRGRDQGAAMERLARIVSRLSASELGVTVDELLRVAGFPQSDSGKRQLQRELKHLAAQGWVIDNVARPGTSAQYKLRARDNRLTVRLSVPQAAALQRAVLVAQREDLVKRLGLPDEVPAAAPTAEVRVAEYAEVLDEVMATLKHRGRLHCRYNGKERLVDPQVLEPRYGDWYLRVLENDAEPDAENLKTFLVSRMSETRMVDPGHGRRVEGRRHVALHPLGWERDPPVEVVLRTAPGYRADVVRWMREPAGEEEKDGRLEMRYQVTNRSAFRHRLYELGTRVEVLGPPEFRAELLAELSAFADGRQA